MMPKILKFEINLRIRDEIGSDFQIIKMCNNIWFSNRESSFFRIYVFTCLMVMAQWSHDGTWLYGYLVPTYYNTDNTSALYVYCFPDYY